MFSWAPWMCTTRRTRSQALQHLQSILKVCHYLWFKIVQHDFFRKFSLSFSTTWEDSSVTASRENSTGLSLILFSIFLFLTSADVSSLCNSYWNWRVAVPDSRIWEEEFGKYSGEESRQTTFSVGTKKGLEIFMSIPKRFEGDIGVLIILCEDQESFGKLAHKKVAF